MPYCARGLYFKRWHLAKCNGPQRTGRGYTLETDATTAERRMIMSKDYPCVYWNDGKCKKFSDDDITSWCVWNPCDSQTPSNADKIRSMSDEELAVAIAEHACTGACNDFGITVNVKCCRNCTKCTGIIDWLKQPAEVSK